MFVEYDDKGEIYHICFLHAVETPQAMRDEGKNILELDPEMFGRMNSETHYVDAGELKERPASPLLCTKTAIMADDEDAVVLTGVTKDWTIYVDGLLMALSDEPLEFTSAIAHDYEIIGVGPWPYMPFKHTVSAM
jgi:hypothetical protein